MIPGERTYESASLTVAIPEAVPEHMTSQVRELLAIETPPEDQNQGYASALLREVVMEADDECTVLLIWVHPYGAMSSPQLQAWYRKYGFEVIQLHPAVLMARSPRFAAKGVSKQLSELSRATIGRSVKLALN